MISFKRFYTYPQKKDFYAESRAINVITWGKNDQESFVNLHLSNVPFETTIQIGGTPETINQMSFEGLLIKFICHRLKDEKWIKYAAWLNPENITQLKISLVPAYTDVVFNNGCTIIVCQDIGHTVHELIEHKKKINERKKEKYGKK